MSKKETNQFFNDIDYTNIINNIKGIYTSNGSMAVLLDFERVLDEANLYAFKNWDLGELVKGPDIKKYTVSCTFMYPEKLMPDPKGCEKLLVLGCNILWKKTKIKVPVHVEGYEDFVPGTRYPRSIDKKIWLISIEMKKDIMNEMREGSIDLAGKKIDLSELDDSYDKDLDTDQLKDQDTGNMDMNAMPNMGLPMAGGGMPPAGLPGGNLPAL
jgi:hypothetical protein